MLIFGLLRCDNLQNDTVREPDGPYKICIIHLRPCEKGTRKSFKYGVLMIWHKINKP